MKLTNFFSREKIDRPEPRMNAVVVQYDPSVLDDDDNMRPMVHVECKDKDMEYFLTNEARNVLWALNEASK